MGAQVSFLRLEVSPWLEWGRSPLSDWDLKGGAKCLPPQSCSSLMWQDPRPPLDQPLRPQTSWNNYIWKAGALASFLLGSKSVWQNLRSRKTQQRSHFIPGLRPRKQNNFSRKVKAEKKSLESEGAPTLRIVGTSLVVLGW